MTRNEIEARLAVLRPDRDRLMGQYLIAVGAVSELERCLSAEAPAPPLAESIESS